MFYLILIATATRMPIGGTVLPVWSAIVLWPVRLWTANDSSWQRQHGEHARGPARRHGAEGLRARGAEGARRSDTETAGRTAGTCEFHYIYI